MNVARSIGSGALWSIHASFQDASETAPTQDYWGTDDEAEDDDDELNCDDVDQASAYVRLEDTAACAPPVLSPMMQRLLDASSDEDSYHSARDTDSEQSDDAFDKADENLTDYMLESKGAEFDLEPHLEYTQQLISQFVIDRPKSLKGSPPHNDSPTDVTQTFTLPSEDDLEAFPLNVPPRLPDSTDPVEKCFGVQLLSPSYFASPESLKPKGDVSTPKKSCLSDMITPMSPDLFYTPATRRYPSSDEEESMGASPNSVDKDACSVAPSVSTMASNATGKGGDLLKMHQYVIRKPAQVTGTAATPSQSKLANAFKSSVREDSHIVYTLAKGKKGMSESQRLQSETYLPHDPLKEVEARTPPRKITEQGEDEDYDEEESTSPIAMPSSYNVQKTPAKSPVIAIQQQRQLVLCPDSKTALSVLLIERRQKIFEIVAVEHTTAETTVGDVLSKARTLATDSRLSQQTYVSLCNGVNELAAPMLPVNLIVDAASSRSRVKKGGTSLKGYDKRESVASKENDPSMGRLLIAVPEGSSPAEVRQIQRALWAHPRVQRWWRRENRYSGLSRHGRRSRRKSGDDAAAVDSRLIGI